MLKELFNEMINTGKQLVEGQKEHEVMEINDEKFIYKMPQRILSKPYQTTDVSTLSGIVDYIKSGADSDVMTKTLLLQIESPTCINLLTEYNGDKDRNTIMRAKAVLPNITLNQYIPLENMNIMLQAAFEASADKATILQALSSVKMTDSVQLADDGISQKVTMSKGDELFEKMTLPNPVELRPFRTFIEIPQPECLFVLRIKEGSVALFDADGGSWKVDAVLSLKDYLKNELAEYNNIKIIA